MSSTLPPSTTAIVPDSNHREPTIDFVRWALAQLEMEVTQTGNTLVVQLPEADRVSFSAKSELRLSIDPSAADNSCEPIHLESRFGKWLLERLHSLGPVVNIRPATQPTAVKDITQRLFDAYQVDSGSVHLGGCQLSDYPFLRLSFAAQQEGQEEIRHVFVAHDGSSISDQLAHDLGLLEVEPVLQRPPRIEDTAQQALIAAGCRVAAQSINARDPNTTIVPPIATALLWVKHAEGKLHFTVGETTVDLPFSGWAKLITPQPYTSPQSGASGFQLAATDDGRIDLADQIVACQQSGRRVLGQELVTCDATGKHVLEELTEICPVSGRPCLSEAFATCTSCQQRVSKSVLASQTCSACRQLTKIPKDDPRLVWILGEHIGLDRWNSWQLAETQNVYITLAKSWTKRLFVVIDKETLAVHHLATASRFANAWLPVTDSAQAEILQ